MPAALLRVALAILVSIAAPQAPKPPVRFAVTHTARALQPGEVVRLTAIASASLSQVEAHLPGRPAIHFWQTDDVSHRWTGLVGIDVEAEPGPLVVGVDALTVDGRSITATHTLTIAPKTFASRHLRVDPRFSDPPESVRPRIAAEAARLDAIFSVVSLTPTPDVPFAAPVPQPPNSRFGLRSFFNGKPRSRHNGADFPSPAGTPIHAPARGRIVLVDDLYFTGHTVVIDHGYGLYTLFAHLERTKATAGVDVARGDVVGFVGATGRVTGPHLHWSLRLQGARVDPLSLTQTKTIR